VRALSIAVALLLSGSGCHLLLPFRAQRGDDSAGQNDGPGRDSARDSAGRDRAPGERGLVDRAPDAERGLVDAEGPELSFAIGSDLDDGEIMDDGQYFPQGEIPVDGGTGRALQLRPEARAASRCSTGRRRSGSSRGGPRIAELCGLPAAEARERAHAVLAYVGLEDKRYMKVHTYSTGQKQRVKLAQALVHDPETCRHELILRYFGDHTGRSVCGNRCDNCLGGRATTGIGVADATRT
jgi:ABC-type sugar transport system ATPase subunit